jgi:heptosyltransferase-2
LIETTSLNLMLVGGEAEGGRLERLASGLPATRIRLLRNVPLPELGQWLASCALFVGHDSGISHLAAALGLRSLILWGDTAQAIWRPRGKDLTIIRAADGLRALSVPVVANHLEQLLDR